MAIWIEHKNSLSFQSSQHQQANDIIFHIMLYIKPDVDLTWLWHNTWNAKNDNYDGDRCKKHGGSSEKRNV